jgi:hypothetical protein
VKRKLQWDDAFYLARTDPEREPPKRFESEKLPEQPFEFDFPAIERAWAALGVKVNEAAVKIHIVELAQWQRRFKKR